MHIFMSIKHNIDKRKFYLFNFSDYYYILSIYLYLYKHKKTVDINGYILIGDEYGIRIRECCRERAVC